MKNRRLVRPVVEELENRLVPSTVVPPPVPGSPYGLWSSSNWSGIDLVTKKSAVTAVSGSWVVPAVTGTTAAYSSVWVGIDGDGSSTVEQIGTESDTAAGAATYGTPQYYAWFEMYPGPAFWITSITVHPGDAINASVSYVSNRFTLSITDVTTGQSFTTTRLQPGAKRVSAEWIVEAPSTSSGPLPLADFGSVTFTNAQATIGGKTGSILSFVGNSNVINYGTAATGWEGINIIDMGLSSGGNNPAQWTAVYDETSVLNAAGNSFTVQFGNSNPVPPSGAAKIAGPNERMFALGETPSAPAPSFTVAELAPRTPEGISTIPRLQANAIVEHWQMSSVPNIHEVQATREAGRLLGTASISAGSPSANPNDDSDNAAIEPFGPGAWLPEVRGGGERGMVDRPIAQPLGNHPVVDAYFSNDYIHGDAGAPLFATGDFRPEEPTPSGTTGAGALLASMLLGVVWASPSKRRKPRTSEGAWAGETREE